MAYYYPQNYQNYPQIQNGGIVRVVSEDDARKYPVAPGYSVTFISEDGSHCYTKTASFSQFDPPKFEKYRLIKEIEPQTANSNAEDIDTSYVTKAEFEALRDEFEAFRGGKE